MKKITNTVATLLASLVLTGGAMAQNAGAAGQPAQPAGGQPAARPAQPVTPPAEAPKAEPRTPPAMAVWSSPELGKVGDMLVGNWKTTAPIPQAGGEANATTDVVISIAHVRNTELADTLYVETARLDAMQAPYRQAIFQLYKAKGKVRVRTLEFSSYGMDPNALVGLWTIPNFFPDIPKANLLATMDIELAAKGNGFAGKSPYPYPTGRGGAVEMTCDLSFTPDSLVVADRGFDAEGKVVWGASEKDKYTFAKFASPLKVEKRDNGLVWIDYTHPSEGPAVAANDRVTVQYSGWLTNGFRFDSSKVRNQPYTYSQGSMIAGWNEGLIGATKGTIRRMYIPGELGFGEKGNARAAIPANSDLIFEVEILHTETPPPPVPSPAPTAPNGAEGGQPAGGQPAAGGQPGGQPTTVQGTTGKPLPPFVKRPEPVKPADPAPAPAPATAPK